MNDWLKLLAVIMAASTIAILSAMPIDWTTWQTCTMNHTHTTLCL